MATRRFWKAGLVISWDAKHLSVLESQEEQESHRLCLVGGSNPRWMAERWVWTHQITSVKSASWVRVADLAIAVDVIIVD
jgi:hypothetical protein